MFELPELANLALQMRETLAGKKVADGCLGNSPHKFVWYNRTPDEFKRLVAGTTVGEIEVRGRWMFAQLLPGYVLTLGEFGGRLFYHPPGAELPQKYHLMIRFEDGASLTLVTQMWGAVELYEAGAERERQYVKGMRPTPVDREFSPAYFRHLIECAASVRSASVKALLTQEQLVPGVGNSIAQEIMFRAGLNPRRPLSTLCQADVDRLYDAIIDTVREAIAAGGRSDEVDLFGCPGGFVRVMDRKAVGTDCPNCGEPIVKMQYLGGACYYCPKCQP